MVVLLCVGVIISSRVLCRAPLLEFLCLAVLLVLEVLPRLLLPLADGPAMVWRSEAGRKVLLTYEALVFNRIYDLDNNLLPRLLVLAALPLLLLRRSWRRRIYGLLEVCCGRRQATVVLEQRHWLGKRGIAGGAGEPYDQDHNPLSQVVIKGE